MGFFEEAQHFVGSTGFNRSFVVRRLVRVGHPALRSLMATAAAPGPKGAAVRPLMNWITGGAIVVPSGIGGGLSLDMAHIPLSHAHLGSLAYGDLEMAVQEAMRRHLADDGVFYDIGANVGFFALVGAILAPHGQVYAFEPTPDNVATIRSNAQLNEFDHIDVIDKAVSDKAGTGRLQVVDDQSWSKLAEYGEHPYTASIMDVELVAIDDLVSAGTVRPPTVVKIDVEGAELAVLKGMTATLAEHRPAIICELHDTHVEVCAFLREHGYRVINLEGTRSVEDQHAPSAHALALPGGHPGD